MKEKLIEVKALIDAGKKEEAKALIDEVIEVIPETMSEDGGKKNDDDKEGADEDDDNIPLPGTGNSGPVIKK